MEKNTLVVDKVYYVKGELWKYISIEDKDPFLKGYYKFETNNGCTAYIPFGVNVIDLKEYVDS